MKTYDQWKTTNPADAELGRDREMEDAMTAPQTHCYTCGKPFTYVRYQCPICREWQCSETCRSKHIAIMDRI